MDSLFEKVVGNNLVNNEFKYVFLFIYTFICDELKNKVMKSVILLEK